MSSNKYKLQIDHIAVFDLISDDHISDMQCNSRLTSMSDSESDPKGECVTLTAELAAHKEKLQRETITLWDGGGKGQRSEEVRIVLQGRVLGEYRQVAWIVGSKWTSIYP